MGNKVRLQKLGIGDKAPNFRMPDAQGKLVDLSDYSDTFVLLVFLRYASCPLCNLTIHRLTLEYPLLGKNGCQIITFVQSSPDNISKYIYGRHTRKPPFPIIADNGRVIYNQYGVGTSLRSAARRIKEIPYWLKAALHHGFMQGEVDGNLLLVPAYFLITPDDQKIARVEYGSSFYEHKTFTDIYEYLTFETT